MPGIALLKRRASPVRGPSGWCQVILVVWLVGWAASGGAALCAQAAGVAETYREGYDFGFRDGQIAGRQDRQAQANFDVANKTDFQEATHGFSATRHDKNVYVVAYRRGFEDGYEDGYGLQQQEQAVSATDRPPPSAAVGAPGPRPVAAAAPSRSVLPAGTLVVVELLDTLSTKYNERGDQFTSRVFRDVEVEGRTLIPRGSQIWGSISYLKRAGRIRGRAQINLRFEELRLADGRRFPLEASVVDLETRSEERLSRDEGAILAPASKGDDAKTVGKASGVGAVVGALGGGKQGAGVGAAAGAVAGLAAVLVTRGRDAQLEARTQLTIRLMQELPLQP